jgi:uncharacterized protein (DUF58 family)
LKLGKKARLKEKQDRVYIVPTRHGFVYGAVVVTLISLSTIFSSTNLLLSCAVLVTFGVVCMHQTHMNVVSLKIKEVETQSGFAEEKTPWRFRILNAAATASFSVNIMEDVVDVPAREMALENISVQGTERGHFRVKEIKLSSTYPLGLFYAWKWAEVDLSYYIYPALSAVGALLAPFSDRKSELSSRDDFIGHREFLPGDSAHHIDWKVHARQQKLLIKLFDSTSTEAAILDWSRIPGENTEVKLSLLARSIYECHRSQKPYGMIFPDLTIPIGEGPGHYERCLQQLATFGKPSRVQNT